MKIRLLFFSAILFSVIGCNSNKNQNNSKVTPTKSENVSASNQAPNNDKNVSNEGGTPTPQKTEKVDHSICYNLKRDDLMLDKKQTFAIDFKPFEKSCFVTFHDPEFDNPPLGSQFFIYKAGKEIFNFPDQFGGGNTTCWIDAVAFEDLNDDQLKDIIIAGKCGAKSSDYNENMVYINTGKGFETNMESNAETMDFSKTSQIRDFVKKNPKMFIP
jgi:hypothetical protein